jgi:hypothetical protein
MLIAPHNNEYTHHMASITLGTGILHAVMLHMCITQSRLWSCTLLRYMPGSQKGSSAVLSWRSG